MSWLVVGIIPPLLWALVNHTDKYLLSRAHHKSSVNVLMVYSTGFSILVLPILYFFVHGQLFNSWLQVGTQILGGILLTASIYFYLMALNKDETSVVMPLSLLVPVFGFIFSYFVLGETLIITQVIACILIIGGSLILSLEFEEERKIRMRHGVLGFMVLATMFQAVQETLFKYVSIENSFAVSFFWFHVGILFCGAFLLLAKPTLLGDFLYSIRINGSFIFILSIIFEAVSALAYMVRDYATLLAPITIVMSLSGYQPVFVFLLGVFFTIFLPQFVNEKIRPVHLFHKLTAILIILIGTMIVMQVSWW